MAATKKKKPAQRYTEIEVDGGSFLSYVAGVAGGIAGGIGLSKAAPSIIRGIKKAVGK